MRTNAVFSRIALVSCFCAESQLSGKTPEKIANLLFYQKTHGARRGVRDGPRVAQTTGWRGQGAHRASHWGGRLGHLPESPFRLLNPLWPKTRGGRPLHPETSPYAATIAKPISGTRNSVLALRRDGELEEIIAIIITDASPSTIHVSPIHVWVIPCCRLRGMVGIGWDCSCNKL